MAIDSNQIKGLIDSNLTDNTSRNNKASVVRSVLKLVVDWVATAVSGNVSTWLRISDNQPGGANGDGVYRTGLVQFRGGVYANTTQTGNAPLASTPFSNNYGVMVRGAEGSPGGPAWMEFVVPNVGNHQLGLDNDGVMKVRPWDSNMSNQLVIDGITPGFKLTPSVANKKLALYDDLGNQHQFYGFGVNSGALRYQVLSGNDAHVFYAGTSPATSKELMRIVGTGQVGIGAVPVANNALEVAGGWISATGNMAGYNPNTPRGLSFGWNKSGGEAESNIVFGSVDYPNNYLAISNWNGLTMTERMRLTAAGWLGLAGSAMSPTSMLHVKAPNGHQQLRLETAYTPTGVSDPNGQVGQVCWDASYIYVKVAAGQWRRANINGGW